MAQQCFYCCMAQQCFSLLHGAAVLSLLHGPCPVTEPLVLADLTEVLLCKEYVSERTGKRCCFDCNALGVHTVWRL